MTISKAQLKAAAQESYQQGRYFWIKEGEEKYKSQPQEIRKAGIVELTKAAAELAQANAKLTYAMSRIADKLL